MPEKMPRNRKEIVKEIFQILSSPIESPVSALFSPSITSTSAHPNSPWELRAAVMPTETTDEVYFSTDGDDAELYIGSTRFGLDNEKEHLTSDWHQEDRPSHLPERKCQRTGLADFKKMRDQDNSKSTSPSTLSGKSLPEYHSKIGESISA
ncbi:hypothetical protein GG344DRAFT_76211 [Lentinula edodes]|nr:hypothetical protein GG344DRAFT_76211 [Lentinula edodes]